MTKRSAGLLMYRIRSGYLQVLLVHPGGPFWAKKDGGAWSIPKGEIEVGEETFQGAQREFHEETGLIAAGPFLDLGEVKQNGKKSVVAWAFQGDCDPASLISIPCRIEWPPRTGRVLEFPEIDRGDWFSLHIAREKILTGQSPLLDRLSVAIGDRPSPELE